MNKEEKGLLYAAIIFYGFGLTAALFYTYGIDPSGSISSQGSFYVGITGGLLLAGFLMSMPLIVVFFIMLSDESAKERAKKEQERTGQQGSEKP